MSPNATIALITQNRLPDNFTRLIKRLSLISTFILSCNLVWAQVSITQLSTPYTQDFNSIGNSKNATLPTGFLYGSDWGISTTNNFTVTTGAVGSSAGTTGLSGGSGSPAFYNYANGDSASSTDRAIGFFTNGTYKSHRSILYAFTNNTGSVVTAINVGWNYEKYRNGTLGSTWKFYHGSATNSFTLNTVADTASSSPGLRFSNTTGVISGMMVASAIGISPNTVVTSILSPKVGINVNTVALIPSGTPITFSSTANTSATAGDTSYAADLDLSIVNPPTSGAKKFTISGLTIPDGGTYYLRWTYYSGSTANGNGKALGIDDFSISLSDGNCSPSLQAKIDSITSVTTNQMTLNYTRGNGDSVLIIASTNNSLSANPANDSLYLANALYGSGTALGGGFVVYKDKGLGKNTSNNTVTITGLKSSTPYYYYIFEFNALGTGLNSCYKTLADTFTQNTASASNDYYRSRQSTQWNDPNTWESSYDSVKWVTSTLKPTSSARSILIKDSVTITAAESARLLTIASAAKLTYTTPVGFLGGYTLTIADDGTSAFDFNIYGTYVVFGNPAALTSPATVKIFNGGLIRADANSGGGSDNFAFNASVYFTNGAVFEWNTSVALNSSNTAYFKYNNSQPTADIAIFRVSKPLSLGATGATTINGILEANARMIFSGSGDKILRNGRIGTGNLIQTGGTFIFTDNATWGGTGIDSLNVSSGLRISTGKTTTLVGNKTIQGGPLYVDGTLNLSNYDLTLASTAAATASLGKMGASGVINYSGSGRFIAERYISTGTGPGQHGKSWQLLATPTSGDNQTINAAWQEGATTPNENVHPGYGTQITGLGGSANGFDMTTLAPSIKSYDVATDSWAAVTRTDTILYNKKGYMLFVRGDRAVSYGQAATPTVLRTRGQLSANGNLPPSIIVSPGKFESMGNPYASAIEFTTIRSESTPTNSIDAKFYLWDPTLSSVGGWQTFSSAASYIPTVTNTLYPLANTKIQSGQAFFVTSTTGSTVNFSENAKVTDNRLVNRISTNIDSISMLSSFLVAVNNGTPDKIADGNRIVFNNDYSNDLDENDAVKIINPGENLGISQHSSTLAIEARQELASSDTIYYYLSGLNQINYQLKIAPQLVSSPGLSATLIDKYSISRIPVSLTDTTSVDFVVNADVLSKQSDRFMLVFQRASIALPVTITAIAASRNSENTITVKWNVENEINIHHYDVERSNDGSFFNQIATQTAISNNGGRASYSYIDNHPETLANYYRVKAISQDGQIQYSAIVKVASITTSPSISISPNPATGGKVQVIFSNQQAGACFVQLSNMQGQLLYKTKWLINAGNQHHEINLGSVLSVGVYQLKVIFETGETKTLRLTVK